jgi:asparagine synthase (glutamine-hydrolysing)
MCGIAGLIDPSASSYQIRERLTSMLHSLSHRGPDDQGVFVNGGIGLAHARLSIIDLAGGHQPLTNEDDTLRLVVNGEIYNYTTLRNNLLERGHVFRTKSDSEVILHLYEDHGEACVEHLEGMFSFALFDHPRKRLFLVRDRLGIKPLYLARSREGVYFASELTALLKVLPKPFEIDEQALYAYMAFSYVPSPLSIIKGIRKLRPAEMASVDHHDQIKFYTYWRPRIVSVPNSRWEAMRELEDRIRESVRQHLLSDVPVAAFLSGGVDSSTVVAMAHRANPMVTLCASFPGTDVDEAPFARQVAAHLGTDHHELIIDCDPKALLLDVVNYMDEPFADSSALPTFVICRAAREYVKVVLSGDGGDEVFGGYTGRYRVAALKAVLPHPSLLARLLRSIPPWRSGRRYSLPVMLDLAALPDEERYVRERQITTASDRQNLLNGREIKSEKALRAFAADELSSVTDHHPVHRALWLDIRTSLPDDMLTKVDRMSMANGLEVRVPLLHHSLVEYALSLPPTWLVSPLPVEGKRLLRSVAAPLLPGHFLDRPKQGFVVPLNNWLRQHYLPVFDEMCSDETARIFRHLNRSAVVDIRRRPFGIQPREDLYSLVVLEMWLRKVDL